MPPKRSAAGAGSSRAPASNKRTRASAALEQAPPPPAEAAPAPAPAAEEAMAPPPPADAVPDSQADALSDGGDWVRAGAARAGSGGQAGQDHHRDLTFVVCAAAAGRRGRGLPRERAGGRGGRGGGRRARGGVPGRVGAPRRKSRALDSKASPACSAPRRRRRELPPARARAPPQRADAAPCVLLSPAGCSRSAALSPDDVRSRRAQARVAAQESTVAEVASLLGVSAGNATLLLRAFRWNQEARRCARLGARPRCCRAHAGRADALARACRTC
jgi:hypothetical protein